MSDDARRSQALSAAKLTDMTVGVPLWKIVDPSRPRRSLTFLRGKEVQAVEFHQGVRRLKRGVRGNDGTLWAEHRAIRNSQRYYVNGVRVTRPVADEAVKLVSQKTATG